ncbi:MAG: pantetheine-phosphate adenylyltransferase [Proteobacteria bacterium]|nr:MAG: pantetheine-phosphate adenylyltransferase [Pseudomonadota bacterium]
MTLAIYPGSFDPVTNGHLDILARGRALFDKVIVAVATNINKKGLFSGEERVELLRRVITPGDDVEVGIFDGLLIDYARQRKAKAIVRGLRAVADFEYEFQLALMNRRLAGEIDTVFLMTDEDNFFVSSSLVREVARFHGDVSAFVPPAVEAALKAKFV